VKAPPLQFSEKFFAQFERGFDMDWKGIITYICVLAILAAAVITIIQLGMGA